MNEDPRSGTAVWRREWRAAQVKPCSTADCGGTAKRGSRFCSVCNNVKYRSARVCSRCGKDYKGPLHGGIPLCATHRLTPEGWSRRAARNADNSARRRGAARMSAGGISWRSLWATGVRHCAYCGVRCNPDDNAYGHVGPTYPTLDHVVPLVLGGEHATTNAVLACFDCNARKGAKSASISSMTATKGK